MSSRFLLAIPCAAIALFICGRPTICVAQAPVGRAQHISIGLVPDNAFAAIDVYPRRALTDPAFAKFKLDDFLDVLSEKMHVAPTDLDELVILLGPPDPSRRSGPPRPNVATIVRFASPKDSHTVAQWSFGLKRAIQFEIDGHKCLHADVGPASDESWVPAITMLDDRTVIETSQGWLPKVLRAKDAKSTLITALAATDASADATLILSNTDVAKGLIRKLMPPVKELPTILQPVAPLPELVRSAKLSIFTRPEVSLTLNLVADDAESAGKLAAIVTNLQQMGKAIVSQLASQSSDELAAKLVQQMTPKQSGKEVALEFRDLGKLGEMVENMPHVHYKSAMTYASLGELDKTIASLKQELQIDPHNESAQTLLTRLLARREVVEKALKEVLRRLEQSPKDPALLDEGAWILATSPYGSLRDGPRAVSMAERAWKITGGDDPQNLGTLAAAYAEVGRFDDAIAAAERGVRSTESSKFAAEISKSLQRYKDGKTIRDMR